MVPEVLFYDSTTFRTSFRPRKQDEFEEDFLQYQEENSTEESNDSILDHSLPLEIPTEVAQNLDQPPNILEFRTKNLPDDAEGMSHQKQNAFSNKQAQQEHFDPHLIKNVGAIAGQFTESKIDPENSSISTTISKTTRDKTNVFNLEAGKSNYAMPHTPRFQNRVEDNQIVTLQKIDVLPSVKNNDIGSELKKLHDLFPDLKIKNLIYDKKNSKSRGGRLRKSKYSDPNLQINPSRHQAPPTPKKNTSNRLDTIMNQRIRFNGDMIESPKVKKIGVSHNNPKNGENQGDQFIFSPHKSFAPFAENLSEISQNNTKGTSFSPITELINKIQSLLSNQPRDAIAKLSLEVNIKTLGNLEITFQEKGTNLQITIHADSEAAKSHLNDSRQELLSQMRRLGYDDISFDVNTNKKDSNRKDQKRSQDETKYDDEEADIDNYETVADSILNMDKLV